MTDSNQNATLATAKHGGCVQLPTSKRERFEAWAKHRVSSMARAADGEYVSSFTHALWCAWQAALTAQPSPVGQTDAWATKLARESAFAHSNEHAYLPQTREETNSWQPHEWVVAAIQAAALGAPQPVGEPVAWMTHHDEPMLFPTAAEAGAYCDDDEPPIPLYATPPAQQPAQVYLDGLDRALGEAIDQRDHYHEVADDLAGHIAAITGVGVGEHSSANCPWQNAIEAAEEYKPAQAVDLGTAVIPDTPEVATHG